MLGEAVVIDPKRARVARLRSADAPAPSSAPGDRTMKNPGFFTASPD